MEEFKKLILEFRKKYNTVIKVTYHSEVTSDLMVDTDKTGPIIIIRGLDWNDRYIIVNWDSDIEGVLRQLLEDRYSLDSPMDVYRM